MIIIQNEDNEFVNFVSKYATTVFLYFTRAVTVGTSSSSVHISFKFVSWTLGLCGT